MKHLLGNMLFLVPFGGLLTFYFGWKMFPFYSLILGIIAQIISLKTYARPIGLQGASGVLYVMFGLWLSLYYKAEVHIPRGKRWLRIIGFCLVMMVPSEFSPRVSYRSHFIGLAIGLIAGIIYGIIAHEEFERRNKEYDQNPS
jgi:membrane associated rhomboid family serine protease